MTPPGQPAAERTKAQRETDPGIFADWEQRIQLSAPTFLSSHVQDCGAQMIGISGTITTVAAVLLDLPRYDRHRVDGTWIAATEVASVTRDLTAMSYAERVAHPCIRRGRADLVLPGCAALEAILATWRAERVRVADRGLREGILRRLMGTSGVVGSPVAA